MGNIKNITFALLLSGLQVPGRLLLIRREENALQADTKSSRVSKTLFTKVFRFPPLHPSIYRLPSLSVRASFVQCWFQRRLYGLIVFVSEESFTEDYVLRPSFFFLYKCSLARTLTRQFTFCSTITLFYFATLHFKRKFYQTTNGQHRRNEDDKFRP